MIKLNKPIIVEGKYDKITLENVVDTLIIPTDGFSIFKNKEKCDMIRLLAKKHGIIVLTDSDSAGSMIRAHIKKIAGECEIINVYVPRIAGKEKRKAHFGKEGILGVEGMTPEIIENALKKSGVFSVKTEERRKITKADMFAFGLSGGEDSREKRKSFLRQLGLPESLSSSAMLDVLNNMLTFEEFNKKAETFKNNGKF